MADFISPRALNRAREQYVLVVAYSCAIENGDAHLKNFAVLYENPEREVRLAPAYDILSTTPYLPRDTLALTLNGTKSFPTRDSLVTFMKNATGKSERTVLELLDRVVHGVSAAIDEARRYGREHSTASRFAQRLTEVMTRGLDRLGYKPVSISPPPSSGRRSGRRTAP
jgi:serine/threonine-protein kinase HipA